MNEDLDLAGKVKLLNQVPLLANIGPSNVVDLATACQVLTFSPGQALFRQGDVGREAYIIIDGEAEVVTEGPNGNMVVATLGQYQFIGEIALLIDVPRTATVIPTSPLSTLMISKTVFYHMVAEHPVVGIEVMRELARRLYETTGNFTQVGYGIDTVRLSG